MTQTDTGLETLVPTSDEENTLTPSEQIQVLMAETRPESAMNNSTNLATFGQFVWFFMALAIVVVLAIYVTRFVARQRIRLSGKNIKIIDSAAVSQNASIAIVQVGSKYLLLGATKDSVRFLQNIAEEDLDLSYLENNEQMSFQKYFEKILVKKGKDDDKTI